MGRTKKYTEEETKKGLIEPLFQALGWDTTDNHEVSAEESISGDRVDYGFYINGRIQFYLEAKPVKADLSEEKYANQAANKVIQRIAELQAARTPQQLPGGARFHEHSGKRKGLFSVNLVHPMRLIVRPTCSYATWVEITSVEIYEIMDPH